MVTAFRIFESFGPGVATTLVAGRPVEVTGLHVYGDPAGAMERGALVLATGALTEETQLEVMDSVTERQAAGVLLRGPVADRVRHRAADSHLALGELAENVGWVQFISMADAMLQHVHAPLDNAHDAHQRIFRLSDDVAELLAAPITVEDLRSQVVAYSAFGETADQVRMDSILGRAVPDKIVTQLRAAGTFRRLAASHEPFKVEIEDPGFLTRLVVPIRVGPEVIGSIWAIHNGELTPQKRQRLLDMARSLGLLLVRLRAHEELSSRYTADRIREAFRRPVDSSSTEPLVLPAREVRVAALGRLNGTSAQNDLAVWRTVFRRHAWADPILTDMEGLVYAILTDGDGPGSWTWARSLSLNGRIGQVGASRPASSATALPARSREALEVLGTGVALERPAVSYEEVWAQVVIRRTHANLPGDLIHDLSRLEDKGRDRRALASTLLTWLMNWGDYNRAARILRLHPNTVRQRMRRIEHLIHRVDLSDPEQRLAVTLVLQAHLQRDEPVRTEPDKRATG
ncbi:helix-turn-helix domain-containing protein [Streptomyces sp. NPDC047985]|uniref:PucR family transcriptional regulator n=1 Tax=Streptomyces sp. NPDC047985 TaxID=3155384 RepID=UPI00344750B3